MPDMTQERHIRHDRCQIRNEAGCRQRNPATLTPSQNCHALGVHSRVRTGGFHGSYCITKDPPIIIGLRIKHTSCHKSGNLGIAAI